MTSINTQGLGYVNSVVSTGVIDLRQGQLTLGPYFGADFGGLYNLMRAN